MNYHYGGDVVGGCEPTVYFQGTRLCVGILPVAVVFTAASVVLLVMIYVPLPRNDAIDSLCPPMTLVSTIIFLFK